MLAESFVVLSALLSINGMDFRDPVSAQVAIHSLPVAAYVSVLPPIKLRVESEGVDVTAKAAITMDVDSGKILFEKDADEVYAIASLTKLVTAMTFLDGHPNLKEEVTIVVGDDAHDGKDILQNGERLSQEEVLRALLVGSVNAAGNVIARISGGQKTFVVRMNQKAQKLGLHQAMFVDPTGLDPNNQATARDVAMMLRAALSYPEIRVATEQPSCVITGRATGKPYEIKSTNLLLDSFLNKAPYQIVAAKTGSLPEAGYCFAQVTKRQAGGEVISVVLGSENHFSRFQDVKALTYWAFQTYQWPRKASGS
jgi:D-alanyl-D-alanine endopeptidase (penicillin-binding protein 7)